jgi:hypothetical protein
VSTLSAVNKLKTYLLAQTWTATSNKVFHPNSVVVTAGPDAKALSYMVSPMALIHPKDATSDAIHDEEPDLLMENISVRLIVIVPGDAVGQGALVGANNPDSSTTSKGRGLLEVEVELYNAIYLLNLQEGLNIQSRAKSAVQAEIDPVFGYIASREYSFEAIIPARS